MSERKMITVEDRYHSGAKCWISYYEDAPNYVGYGDTPEIAEARLAVITNAVMRNEFGFPPQSSANAVQ